MFLLGWILTSLPDSLIHLKQNCINLFDYAALTSQSLSLFLSSNLEIVS
jgi:hypothetical protein